MHLGASTEVPNSHVNAISIILSVFFFLLLLALKRKARLIKKGKKTKTKQCKPRT